MNILMIGNSFSFYNRLNRTDGILYEIARQNGEKAAVTPIYKGGYYLRQFLDPSDPFGYQTNLLLRSDIPFDAVVLQDQSSNPIRHYTEFRDCVARFRQLSKGQLYLYATWGYHDLHPKVRDFGKNMYEMEQRLRTAYQNVGIELDIPVANVGEAWVKVYRENPEIILYSDDWKHPSVYGSVLAAWVLFGKLFGRDPVECIYDSHLDPKKTAVLQKAASMILRGEKEPAPQEKAWDQEPFY